MSRKESATVDEQRRREERIVRAQDIWRSTFDLYATDGCVEGGIEGFTEVLHAVGSRLVDKEIQEAYEAMGSPEEVTWQDIKPLTIKEPQVMKGWKTLCKHETGLNLVHMKDPENVFQQLLYGFQFLQNSSPESGRVDVSYLQYLVSSRGDEMNGDKFEEFLKALGHPVKGNFDVVLFMQVYLKYAMKAGLLSDEDVDKAKGTIQVAHERFGVKPKKRGSLHAGGPRGNVSGKNTLGLEHLANNVPDDDISDLSEEPKGGVRRRQSLFPMSGRASQIGARSSISPLEEEPATAPEPPHAGKGGRRR
jgi:hypothetical protein